MCLNRAIVRQCGSAVVLKFFVFIVALIMTPTAHAEPLKISLLLGDSHSKTAIEAVKAIERAYPELKRSIRFEILTGKSIRDGDALANRMMDSKVVFILIMDRQAVEKVKPYIKELIKKGSKVYSIGGTYTKEHKDMGLIDDLTVRKYYEENGLKNIKKMILFVMNRDLGLDVRYKEPVSIPDFGIYLKSERRVFETFEEYLKHYQPNLYAHKWAQGSMIENDISKKDHQRQYRGYLL